MESKRAKIVWKQKLFSHTEPGSSQQLLSKVEPGTKIRLLENLNDRLTIQENGEIVLKGEYRDGCYPVFITPTPSVQISDEITRPKETFGKDILPRCESFASSNFQLKLDAVNVKIEETTKGEVRKTFYVFLIQTGWNQFRREVSVDMLEDFGWVKEATEGRAFFSERKDKVEFATYVHEVIERDIHAIERKIIYQTSGWKWIKGIWQYVCDSGIIGNHNANIMAAPDMKFNIDNQISATESIRQFWGMQDICKCKKITHTLMLFASLSVLTTLFEAAGFPVKSLLGIFGTTNTLKTSTALVFSKIFNAREITEPEVTFSSTRAGIETFVSKYSDGILLVDDFMPGEKDVNQAELNSKLELLCRLYGDRTSKKRMTVFADQDVEYPVRGCCMITGELVTGVKSSRTRLLNVKLEEGDVQSEVLQFYQDHPLILPTYLFGLIEFVTINQAQVLNLLKATMRKHRKNFKFSVARLNETAAHYLTMLDLSLLYWRDILPGCDINAIRNAWTESVLSVISENDKKIANVDYAIVILRALDEAMQNNSNNVKSVEDLRGDDEGLIYFDDEFIYVQNKTLYLLTKSFCGRYDISFIKEECMVCEKLKEKKAIDYVKNSKGHIECARKLRQSAGNAKRYLYIKRTRMAELLENIQ